MLNRHILRGKTMQALYAYEQASNSNYELGFDFFDETFAPDLMADEAQDKVLLQQQSKQAGELYKKFFMEKDTSYKVADTPFPTVVQDAIELRYHRDKKDLVHYKNNIKKDTDTIHESYVICLKLLVDIMEYVTVRDEENQKRVIPQAALLDHEKKLARNLVIQKISEDPVANRLWAKNKTVIDRNLIVELFKDHLMTDAEYKKYQALPTSTPLEDGDMALHIAKETLMPNLAFNMMMAEYDLNWDENKQYVKSILYKTLKNLTKELSVKVVLELSPGWEEDLEFAYQLYDVVNKENEELDTIMQSKANNWDSERIVMTDRILIKMALAEMLHFSNIPIKVTINEYIDLSKEYSTPKSRIFVNGMLDALSTQLQKNGMIKKSGRGLIDNK